MLAGKPFWRIDTRGPAREIRDAARTATTEEDLKIRVEPLLQAVFRETGVDVTIRQYEKTTAVTAKRIDVVYGYLVIEYKAPGKLGNARALDGAIQQLQGYLQEESQRHAGDAEGFLEKAVGVIIDGEQIAFVRYSRKSRLLPPPIPLDDQKGRDLFPSATPRKGFQVQGPFAVDGESLACLLIYVRSAARRPLRAEHLAEVFGPDNEVARVAVAELYSAVMRGQRPSAHSRVETLYREWERIFGAVYGERLEKAEAAANETARLYGIATGVRIKPLLFAIHTYYGLLMKLVASELLALQKEEFRSRSIVDGLEAADDATLQERLTYLESGGDFRAAGITNFLEADFFGWYLDVWSRKIIDSVRGMIRALAGFEPATPVLEPDWTRDLLQKLYEMVVPRALRHGLGEYYTPDWLADYLVDRSGYTGDPATRFLDPACGSGTFLVQAIRRVTEHVAAKGSVALKEAGRAIVAGVAGFDLNPLAVLAARTNSLIAFAKFLPHVRPISIPVYLCDSVAPPDQAEASDGNSRQLYPDDTIVFRTRDHDYVFPLAMKDTERIADFCGLVLQGVAGKMVPAAFRKLLTRKFPLAEAEQDRLMEIYSHIKQLHDEKRDGIWAHYIKNAFAPVYVGKFDYVVGNPPWIRWGYLSDEYRARTLPLWHGYGLFSLKGHETRLGAGEKDFSMLFTYTCADRYLKDGGTLAFVITQEVFKSKGAGEGFRRFRIGDKGAPLKVLWMEDMVRLQPFQAANKTTIFAVRKGAATIYPVPVVQWTRKSGVGKIPPEWPLSEVRDATERVEQVAVPVDAAKPVSSWQTASRPALKAFGAVKGANAYKAYLGARVEPYGVFWLNFIELRPDGRIVVENQHDRGKREIKQVRDAIESDLVYPAVAGGDLTRYGVNKHFYALVCQDPSRRSPFSEDWMIENAPLTLAYLHQFRDVLLSRGSNVVRQFAEKTEFYAMYGIGPYTFAPYRVAWKRMASHMAATVLSKLDTPFGPKPVISTDTTSLMVATSRAEAHYLCAVLNSDIVNAYIASFSSGGRGFGAPSVMWNLGVPKFEKKRALHMELAELSEEAHRRVQKGMPIADVDEQVNLDVRNLWNIKS
ncbi:MAG: N-6 DNA methylase [Planctomycetes bacterium]|nr:N-6 DNA methylase [Planctomycetota bacterium]